jgi:hypothetical protein
MKELYRQQWVNLQYDIVRKELLQQLINKQKKIMSSIECEAFEIGENVIQI